MVDESPVVDEAEPRVPGVQVLPSARWQQDLPGLSYAMQTDRGGRHASRESQIHPFAGTGKLIFGLTVAEIISADPDMGQLNVTVSRRHRAGAHTGTLRLFSGELQLKLEDAVHLVLSTGDAAATLALLEVLEAQGADVLSCAQNLISRLGLRRTSVSATESPEASWGEALIGTTCPADLLILAQQLCAALRWENDLNRPGDVAESDGLDLTRRDDTALSAEVALLTAGWMSQVFEPAGLASALPGYGPHRVAQWTLSGWETVPVGAQEGAGSVLITHSIQAGWVCGAAYHPSWHHRHQVYSAQNVSAALGSLGLSAFFTNQT